MARMIDFLEIIDSFYPEDTPLKRLLLKHSAQVRDKALSIAKSPACEHFRFDLELIEAGAMLHDIGIGRCYAPSILCMGTEDYIAHGFLGGAMLRDYAVRTCMDLEPFARICERHTGSGLTAAEIIAKNLPIPHRDFCPETPAERLICYADKFFSKSGDMLEKSPERIRMSLAKFGQDTLDRWDALVVDFTS